MTPEEISFFDRLSAHWDDDETLSTPEKVAEILTCIGVAGGMRVLDLGTGTGVLIPHLARMIAPRGEITAIDMSGGMLSKAIGKYGDLPCVRFIKSDFEETPYEGRYDLIMLYCVYPHLHHPEATLKRLFAENIAAGGKIVIAFPTDERFINSIHRESKAPSDLLPPADALAERLRSWGLPARKGSCDAGRYIVEIIADAETSA